MNQESRNCKNCLINFLIKPEDFAFYEKMRVPSPRLCPECRFRRRAAFRNEFSLYNRKCDLCGQGIISMYNPSAPYVVYCVSCWYSDKWDPFSFGREYDFKRPFFEQFGELMRSVPKIALYRNLVLLSVNSPYENFSGGNKDCYLISNSGPENENCAYSRGLIKSHDVFDGYYVDVSDRVYEGIGIHKSAGVVWGHNVTECLDSRFLINCTGLQNCFGCVNLRHKSYYFLNEPMAKDAYQKRVSRILGSYRAMREFQSEFEKFSLRFPRRASSNLKSVDVDGDYIFESKNCHESFELSYCEDLKYAFAVKLVKDAYDILGHGRDSELLLETVACGFSARTLSSWGVDNGQNMEYCFFSRKSEHCFGCDGIANAKHAILNNRYSEEEYKKIRAHIVEELTQTGEYGLFFPPSLALFAYNETVGQDNVPFTKEEALAQGFRWEDHPQMTTGKETLKSEDIPDHIKDVPDSITDEVLTCVSCARNYKIIPAELEFYRTMLIPIPRQCFFCRHRNRIQRRGPMKIFERDCARCKKPIKTTYAPDRPEIVYCENCYQQEVI